MARIVDRPSVHRERQAWEIGRRIESVDQAVPDRHFAAGALTEPAVGGGAPAAGIGLIDAPASLSSRLNSGESTMIFPAAARSRSTASSGSTKDVGCAFRYSA